MAKGKVWIVIDGIPIVLNECPHRKTGSQCLYKAHQGSRCRDRPVAVHKKIPLFQIRLSRIGNSYLHETFFLILSLASSQSDIFTFPEDNACSRSPSISSCQSGDLNILSSLARSSQSVSSRSSFCSYVYSDKGRPTRSIA